MKKSTISSERFLDNISTIQYWWLDPDVRSFLDSVFWNHPTYEQEHAQKVYQWYKLAIVEACMKKFAAEEIYYEQNPENIINDDIQRKTVDSIIIHHSSGIVDFTTKTNEWILGYINMLHLLRLHAFYYGSENWTEYIERKKHLCSGHFDSQGKQTFIQYHFVVFPNGEFEQILDPIKHLGWHASGANESSVGICLVGNFDESKPNEKMLNTLKKIIRSQKKLHNNSNLQVLGHGESGGRTQNTSDSNYTSCPGKTFYKTNKWGLLID